MSAVQPKCYCGGCEKPAAVGERFCSKRCAADWACEIVLGNEEQWCPVCGYWSGERIEDRERLVCGHIATGLKSGMKHADASRLYAQAIQEANDRLKDDEISSEIEQVLMAQGDVKEKSWN